MAADHLRLNPCRPQRKRIVTISTLDEFFCQTADAMRTHQSSVTTPSPKARGMVPLEAAQSLRIMP